MKPAQQNCTVVRGCFFDAHCRINREAACSRSETLRRLVGLLCMVWASPDSYAEQELRCAGLRGSKRADHLRFVSGV